jgi:S-adenosylmethionine/arginine decarboxylase-like enzyme
MTINSETTFEELIRKATKFLSKKILDSFQQIKKDVVNNPKYLQALLEKNIEIVKLDKNKIIKKIYSQPEDERKIAKNYQKKLKKYINKCQKVQFVTIVKILLMKMNTFQ